MSKIQKAFENGKAFISFITCGDPSLEVTKELIYAIEEAGADLIELGIPFSDPTAEGIVIQSANERALATGITTDKIFEMLADVSVEVPLVFMTYANVLFSYGIERFVKKSKEVGISGIILPDIPLEEKEEFETICTKYELDFISLIAPNSNERTIQIAKQAKGFVYYVSSLGVTGVRSDFAKGIQQNMALIKKHTNTPCAIGFGISTQEQAKEMVQYADGVIVGSAIVKMCEEYKQNCIEPIKLYIRKMKEAIKDIDQIRNKIDE
ncbi:MAG: tryptophan synthase subunit alpha [Eubacteriales bacterium]